MTLLPCVPSRLLPALLLLLALGVAPRAEAQFTSGPTVGNPADQVASGTSFRTFYRPGEDLIRVQVLGDIGSGIYVVGARTTLVELLSLAGGTPLGDRGVQVDQEVTIRVLREQGGQRVTIYEANTDELLARPDRYPTLQDGDLVTVQSRLTRRYNVRETLQIISSVASLALLALRLAEVF